MRSIKLVNIKKSYNNEVILEHFNLTIPSGKFFVILGPSGSGKTTLLRLIGGFETVDEGKIYLGNVDITDVPINHRKVNTVFQNYALFPHLDVYENVAYSLRLKKVSQDIIDQKVNRVIKVVHLEKHINKYINQLSGGQKQRVALARAIINEPDVLLLDEPIAALDVKLREQLLIELIELQKELQTTFVYVTHDQTEALTIADQMIIMNEDGEIAQLGTPKEIYEFPVSSFVAKFIGIANIFKGIFKIQDGQEIVEVAGLGSFKVGGAKDKPWAMQGKEILMSIRPEKIDVTKGTEIAGNFENHLKGKVVSIIYQGRSTQFSVTLLNGSTIQVFEQNDEHIEREIIKLGDEVNLYWKKNNEVLLEK